MNIKEVHELLSKTPAKFRNFLQEEWYYGEDDEYESENESYEVLNEKRSIKEFGGIPANLLNSFRSSGGGDYDGWMWRFQLGDKIYQAEGGYNSWNGCDLPSYHDVYEVEEREVLVKKYFKKNEEK